MSETHTLCGSEVTKKTNSWNLEVEGARAPVPHSWRRQWVFDCGRLFCV